MSPASLLLNQVLALPREEARELAQRVLELTDPSYAEIEEAHYQECMRRLKDLEEGREELIPHEVVMAELREKLARALGDRAG